jgi:biotin transport system substrate-specific component
MVLGALLAALLAASAWVTIPVGTVPITLQVFVVILIALIMRPYWALATAMSYVLAGAVGLPVFSGMRGGVGVLVGPTGGYLLGFIAAAWFGAQLRCWMPKSRRESLAVDAAVSVAVVLVIYAMGWTQLTMVAGITWGEAFLVGVAPFLVPDAAKAVAAVGLTVALRRSGSLAQVTGVIP